MAQYDYLQAAQVLYDTGEAQVQHFIKTEFRQRGAISGPFGYCRIFPAAALLPLISIR